jgi:hypothetical protein
MTKPTSRSPTIRDLDEQAQENLIVPLPFLNPVDQRGSRLKRSSTIHQKDGPYAGYDDAQRRHQIFGLSLPDS